MRFHQWWISFRFAKRTFIINDVCTLLVKAHTSRRGIATQSQPNLFPNPGLAHHSPETQNIGKHPTKHKKKLVMSKLLWLFGEWRNERTIRLPWRCANWDVWLWHGFDYKAINHIHIESASSGALDDRWFV